MLMLFGCSTFGRPGGTPFAPAGNEIAAWLLFATGNGCAVAATPCTAFLFPGTLMLFAGLPGGIFVLLLGLSHGIFMLFTGDPCGIFHGLLMVLLVNLHGMLVRGLRGWGGAGTLAGNHHGRGKQHQENLCKRFHGIRFLVGNWIETLIGYANIRTITIPKARQSAF
jgi:hypothetical protein